METDENPPRQEKKIKRNQNKRKQRKLKLKNVFKNPQINNDGK